MTTTLTIEGMSCGHCVAAVRQALQSVPGLTVLDVHIGGALVESDGNPPPIDAIKHAVEEAGYFAEVASG